MRCRLSLPTTSRRDRCCHVPSQVDASLAEVLEHRSAPTAPIRDDRTSSGGLDLPGRLDVQLERDHLRDEDASGFQGRVEAHAVVGPVQRR